MLNEYWEGLGVFGIGLPAEDGLIFTTGSPGSLLHAAPPAVGPSALHLHLNRRRKTDLS